ncbi:MAG: efflux RND transporter periplasmic adaptor subunit [Bacteroidales bacterium]|nr:efflux RND transporter periplasmic adaptor subunit [Bacteroidales bacterium]
MDVRRMIMGAAVLAVILAGCKGKTAGDEGRDGKLQYTPEVNKVEVVELKRCDFMRQLIANGKLSASLKSALSFNTSGVVSELYVSDGQSVRAGDVLARLDPMEKKLALESAGIALEKAEIDFYDVLAGQGYRAKDTLSVPADVLKMAKMRSGYRSALNSYERSSLDFGRTVLKAPFSGKVADVKFRKYDNVSSGAFCTLIDDSRLDVDFSVLESEYHFLKTGLEVSVTPFTGDGKVLKGSITEINPTVDKHGLVAVRARVYNDGSLIDGMNVKVIVGRTVQDVLVVPKSSVVIRDNQEVLFRYRDGKAMWTYVHVLMSNSSSHVVTANMDRGAELDEGDMIIVSGNLNLGDGSSVQITE